jgi:outer membrane biogenesis lipoprotein LolB
MSDKLTQWKETLEEKTKYRVQLESALNKTTAEILQLQGGIQFAEESTEVNSEESFPENS